MTDQKKDYAKIVARAWSDDSFKAKLLADPTAVLKEAGLNIPDGMTVKAVEDTDKVTHLVLPQKPTGDIDDDALNMVSGGTIAAIAAINIVD